MDSPLNRAGLLQVYVHTEKNALIEINPQTRIPRTFSRFCGLMGKLPPFSSFSVKVRRSGCMQSFVHPHTLLKLWPRVHSVFHCPLLTFSSAASQAECQSCWWSSEASEDDQKPSVWPSASGLPTHWHLLLLRRGGLPSYLSAGRSSCSGDRSVCARRGEEMARWGDHRERHWRDAQCSFSLSF